MDYRDQLKLTAALRSNELRAEQQPKYLQEGERVLAEVIEPRRLARRRVVLAGGAGYIGAPLTAALLERGYAVHCLDLLLYENHAAVTSFLGHPRYTFQPGDIAGGPDVEAALADATDVIILAGLVGDPITRSYPAESAAINEHGILHLLEHLQGRGLNKVIFVSTCSNYGEIPAGGCADEAYPLKPLSAYARAKVKIEGELLTRRNSVDYCGTVLRFATAFGLSPRMRFDLTVSEFVRALHMNNTLDVYDADTWRPYCHVRDFARALIRVLEAPREIVNFSVFNAGGDTNNFTKDMIAQHVHRAIPGSKLNYVKGGADRRNYRVDFSKIRTQLDFEPDFSVANGIDELLGALRAGFFADYARRTKFYRNELLTYRPVG